jgi:hypothetical protein
VDRSSNERRGMGRTKGKSSSAVARHEEGKEEEGRTRKRGLLVVLALLGEHNEVVTCFRSLSNRKRDRPPASAFPLLSIPSHPSSSTCKRRTLSQCSSKFKLPPTLPAPATSTFTLRYAFRFARSFSLTREEISSNINSSSSIRARWERVSRFWEVEVKDAAARPVE